jgi:hypothetical protein
MFEAERPSLVPYAGRVDGFHAMPAAVSKTCLVQFDKNKYSVSARAVGRPVEVRAYADRIELRQDGRIVGAHRRCFGRDGVRSLPLRAGSRGSDDWRSTRVRPSGSWAMQALRADKVGLPIHPDILIHAEQIVRVVPLLDFGKAIVMRTIRTP